MSGLLKNTELWPVNVRLDVPRALAELSDMCDFPFPAEQFTLQVLVKSEAI